MVKLLSVSPEIAKITNLDSLQANRLMLGFDFGFGFIDTSGKPIHARFLEHQLDRVSRKNLSSIFEFSKEPELSTTTDCIPVYRDAIIYYDSLNKPIAHINICFGCQQIIFHPGADASNSFANFDDPVTQKKWKELKDLFLSYKLSSVDD